MKRLLTLLFLFAFALQLQSAERQTIKRYNTMTKTWIETPIVSIYDIQFISQDSLLVAETLPIDNTAQWKLQAAARAASASILDDTVTVVGLVVAPAKVITFTARGWTMLLYDTSTTTAWGGILVRVDPLDTASYNSFLIPEQGDVIMLTGVVQEFPSGQLYSATQLKPVPGFSVDIIGNKAIPAPVKKNCYGFLYKSFPRWPCEIFNRRTV